MKGFVFAIDDFLSCKKSSSGIMVVNGTGEECGNGTKRPAKI